MKRNQAYKLLALGLFMCLDNSRHYSELPAERTADLSARSLTFRYGRLLGSSFSASLRLCGSRASANTPNLIARRAAKTAES